MTALLLATITLGSACLCLSHLHYLLSGVLVGSRILCFSPNIPLRLYPQWAQRVLNVPALPKGEVYKTNEPVEATVSSISTSGSVTCTGWTDCRWDTVWIVCTS